MRWVKKNIYDCALGRKKYLQLYAGWTKIDDYTLGKIKIFTIASWVKKYLRGHIFPIGAHYDPSTRGL